MDQFAEQLVRRIPDSRDEIRRAAYIVSAVAVTAVSVLLVITGFPLALILPVCAIAGCVYLLRMMQTEYEYTCTNGTLDIDKILGQSRRIPMLSVEVSAFTAYGPAGEADAEAPDDLTTFSAVGVSLMGGDDADAKTFYAEFDPPDHGKCCLYFCPDARLRGAIEPFLPKGLRGHSAR